MTIAECWRDLKEFGKKAVDSDAMTVKN